MSGLLAFASAVLAVAGLGLLAPARERAAGRRALAFATRLGGRLRPGALPPGELAGRIAAAGAPGGLGVRDVMAVKLAGAAAGGTAGLLMAAAGPGRIGLLALVTGPAAGFLAPDLWLARRARARAKAMRSELAAMLDLLRVSVESGLSLAAALGAVGERTGGPLAHEWRIAACEVRLGVPLEGALTGMTERAPLPEVQALSGALLRASRHGAPLGETLAAQARDARLARRQRIQEDAARAAPKIQLVVALLLVPSVLLLVAAALVAALLGGGGPAI